MVFSQILRQEQDVEPTGKPNTKKSDLNDKKTKEPTPWALAYEGTQLAVILLVGLFVGFKLDAWKGTSPWFTLLGAGLGLLLGLYGFLKRFLK